MTTLVIKFGGASVASPENFNDVADIVLARSVHFSRIVVVVSAMGDTTNQLIHLARRVHPNPPTRELDMLVSVGERVSISLLAMALSLKNCPAISFTGSQSGIITSSHHFDALILDVKPHRILQELDKNKVVIVAGYQGVSEDGEITTLGRGGSDTSAVALAAALGADKVEFYKDVAGVYTEDPKAYSEAMLHSYLSYVQALRIVANGAKVLHRRAVSLAQKNQVLLHVLPFANFALHLSAGTKIYDKDPCLKNERALFEG